jgi:uncharacterized membrane protein
MPVHIFNTFNDPSSFNSAITQAFGVNDADQIVWTYNSGIGDHAFLLSGGTFTTLDAPTGTLGTFARGINASGQIVGDYRNGIGNGDHGFLLSGGTYTTLDPTGSTRTQAFGINASGQVVGFYNDFVGTVSTASSTTLTTALSPPLTIPRPPEAQRQWASTPRVRSSGNTSTGA